MNAAQTSTLTQSSITSYHGVTALTYSEAMDVDTDGQRLANHFSDRDIMDTALDGPPNTTEKGKAPEKLPEHDTVTAKNDVSTATEPTQVLERPREGGDEVAQDSPKQMCKTPH